MTACNCWAPIWAWLANPTRGWAHESS